MRIAQTALAGEPAQLLVDAVDVRVVDVRRRDGELGESEVVHDLEPPPAARTAPRVLGVGNSLELEQHEDGDHELPVDEPGRHDVGDPPIDDRRGVDDESRASVGRASSPTGARARLAGPRLARRLSAEPDEPQDLPVLARGDAREDVAEHQEHGEQQVVADVRESADRERRERADPEAEQESGAAHDELARRPPLRRSLDPPDRPHDDATEQERHEPAGSRTADDHADPASPGAGRVELVRHARPRRDLRRSEPSQEGEDESDDELQPPSKGYRIRPIGRP